MEKQLDYVMVMNDWGQNPHEIKTFGKASYIGVKPVQNFLVTDHGKFLAAEGAEMPAYELENGEIVFAIEAVTLSVTDMQKLKMVRTKFTTVDINEYRKEKAKNIPVKEILDAMQKIFFRFEKNIVKNL